MGWDTILFDLDGTLTDPKEGITKAVAVALEHFGIHEDPELQEELIAALQKEEPEEEEGLLHAGTPEITRRQVRSSRLSRLHS